MTIWFARHQFLPAIIRHAVWLYLRFTLSYRDAEDLLAERGLDVSYETVLRWVCICRCDDASARCSASNRQDPPNASCPFTPPSKTLSTSRAISRPAAHFASSARKPSGRGEPPPRPESESGSPIFRRPNSVRVTAPSQGLCDRVLVFSRGHVVG